jgi:hypothetical protein
MVRGEDLRDARARGLGAVEHRLRFRRIDHGRLAALVADQEIRVVVAQRGNALDPETHGAGS